MPKKQTVLTYEAFEEHLLPRIQKSFDERFDKLEERLEGKINHLPTKEEYYAREDQTMGELKKLREEVATVNFQYERTNARVDKIDAHLGISTVVI